MNATQEVKTFASAVLVEMMPILDEKQRHLSGVIASNLGYGWVSFVNSITGQSRNTIAAGKDYFDAPDGVPEDASSQEASDGPNHVACKKSERIRRPGGGRKPIGNRYPDLEEKTEEISAMIHMAIQKKPHPAMGNTIYRSFPM